MATRNAAREAADLARLLDDLLGQLTLATARRTDLQALATAASHLAERLRSFDHEVVPLDLKVGSDRTVAAMMEWDALDGGSYSPGCTEFDRTVAGSTALEPLHRAGIDVTGVYKFSRAELQLAHAVADNFDEWFEPWDRLKLALHNQGHLPHVHLKIEPTAFDTYRRFMNKMTESGLLADLTLEQFVFSKQKWIQIKERKVKYLNSGPRLRYSFTIADPHLLGVLTGLWFNAFAFDVIHDQLTRNKIEHELFTNVAYRSPRDILRVEGDFDVLGRFLDTILLIECKSGRLAGKYDVFDDVITKSHGVRRVFELSGATANLVSVLLYNPHLNDPVQVEDRLEGTGILAVKPEELRATVSRLCSTERAPLLTVP